MIELSTHESTSIFETVIPQLRADRRGHYRGPASYRDGDNSTGLSIDLKRGVFFDHVTGEGGDAISFVRLAHGCTFIAACDFVSDIVGRNVRGERSDRPAQPKFSEDELTRADHFRIGYGWFLELGLAKLKRGWLADESAVEPRAIFNATRHLNEVNGWSPRQASEFLLTFYAGNEGLVAQCIKEALTLQLKVAEILTSAAAREIPG